MSNCDFEILHTPFQSWFNPQGHEAQSVFNKGFGDEYPLKHGGYPVPFEEEARVRDYLRRNQMRCVTVANWGYRPQAQNAGFACISGGGHA